MGLSAFVAFKYLISETIKSFVGKVKKVIFPDDQETIKNGLKSIKQGNFQNSPEVSQIFNNCTIINLDGKYGVAAKFKPLKYFKCLNYRPLNVLFWHSFDIVPVVSFD